MFFHNIDRQSLDAPKCFHFNCLFKKFKQIKSLLKTQNQQLDLLFLQKIFAKNGTITFEKTCIKLIKKSPRCEMKSKIRLEIWLCLDLEMSLQWFEFLSTQNRASQFQDKYQSRHFVWIFSLCREHTSQLGIRHFSFDTAQTLLRLVTASHWTCGLLICILVTESFELIVQRVTQPSQKEFSSKLYLIPCIITSTIMHKVFFFHVIQKSELKFVYAILH